MIKRILIGAMGAAIVFSAGCTHRLKVDPIHITVDVNIKVDKELDDFFGDIDKSAPAPATAPAAE
jgi:hypothetical protein